MDQFSHDLTVALEETSLLDRARVSRWGQQRRRTRSTGNLPCAPQPTEDSSSPTDIAHGTTQNTHHPTNTNNNDGLDTQNIHLPSDSDEKDEAGVPRLPCKALNQASVRLMGTLESDSLNETFSPARFFKPNARRKRKLKRITMDYEMSTGVELQTELLEPPTTSNCLSPTASGSGNIDGGTATTIAGCTGGIMRKRVLKPDPNSRSQLFFCGKRKRSNRDRYHEHDHSSSMPRHNNHLDEYRMRPRSFSSTSKPHSDRLLPLNKGLLSKIERISQQQKTETATTSSAALEYLASSGSTTQQQADGTSSTTIEQDTATSYCNTDGETQNSIGMFVPSPLMAADDIVETIEESSLPQISQFNAMSQQQQQQLQQQENNFRNHRKKSSGHHNRRRLLQFAVNQHSMDCEELNDFSSSSLSSSDSEDNNAANDTDREGDDELTDWPGNESICGELKYDSKRKLTKRNALPQIKSDPESVNSMLMAEDDTVMSNTTAVGDSSSLNWPPSSAAEYREAVDLPFQSSEPITIAAKTGFSSICRGNVNIAAEEHLIMPLKQIESEMSGETSNPFLSSPPCQPNEVREIRAGCRRVKGERPGFSIKTSVNERLARFLQDPRQLQIRLPDIEIYEHESLINLATLYSLQMSLDNGCAVLNKTSNTTQSVNIDQQSLQSRLLLSDFKRRCYDSKGSELLHK
ncbi:uncharacterized protein LOC119611542 [Lucilia sericata]|uniref:uncharacterized protein LOC119611542 n=1 Tax=Lucilia sericata TaxID=13632 RepID=UPI0018A8648C|nr:uncharacterized protein LOC119611542 [Lucilia sericata]XP_037823101.1 uncharacterized protein LOC119611542 [Lucilia sericata]